MLKSFMYAIKYEGFRAPETPKFFVFNILFGRCHLSSNKKFFLKKEIKDRVMKFNGHSATARLNTVKNRNSTAKIFPLQTKKIDYYRVPEILFSKCSSTDIERPHDRNFAGVKPTSKIHGHHDELCSIIRPHKSVSTSHNLVAHTTINNKPTNFVPPNQYTKDGGKPQRRTNSQSLTYYQDVLPRNTEYRAVGQP